MPIDLAKYSNDFESIYLKLIPHFWKVTPELGTDKTKFVELLKCIASALANIQDTVEQRASDQKDFLDYTGQHMSLVKLLNDVYDPLLRRIVITENDVVGVAGETWYLDGETDPENKVWYTDGETDPVPKTWYIAADTASEYNFTVEVPLAITFIEAEMRALLDNYVVATRLYEIITV